MTTPKAFNYDEFVRGYRALCEQHGIDPAQGATTYQVIHLRAGRALALRVRSAPYTRGYGWWLRHEAWLDCEPHRSVTEADACWNLFRAAYDITLAHLHRQMQIAQAQRHSWNGRRTRHPDRLPLRELT